MHEYQSFKPEFYKGHKGANDKEKDRTRGMEKRIREKEKNQEKNKHKNDSKRFLRSLEFQIKPLK